MAKAFLDTNVLVYANDGREPAKQDAALALLAVVASGGGGVVSTQCLVEYGAVALRKLRQSPAEIDEQVEFCAATFEVVPVTPDLIGGAVRLALLHQVNYFDALMLAAAESAGCTELYSEDLNAGQSYLGVRVVDPFAA
ncbi:MAG: PIN domain-containing protein [Armatimonadetes bacterium]|nr:PIN domain-containing protein [Armatimonadota bacterium]